jgi:hypothetical protein
MAFSVPLFVDGRRAHPGAGDEVGEALDGEYVLSTCGMQEVFDH